MKANFETRKKILC